MEADESTATQRPQGEIAGASRGTQLSPRPPNRWYDHRALSTVAIDRSRRDG